MKVIIHARKSLNESKLQKRKLRENKQLLREFEPITLALGAIIGALTALLATMFPGLKSLFGRMGEQLEDGAKEAEAGADALPPEAKTDFMQKFNAAEQAFQETIERLEKESKAGGKVTGKVRPSAQIAEKVLDLLRVIEETVNNNQEALQEQPEAMQRFENAKKKIRELAVDIANLDFVAAISSKEDPNGLWSSVEKVEGSATAFPDDDKWLAFSQSYARAIDDKSIKNFKGVTKVPTA